MSGQLESTIPHKTQQHLEWNRLCEALAFRCKGEPAKERALTLQPYKNFRQAQKQLHKVDEARSALDAEHSPPLSQMVDLSESINRAQRGGVLAPEEIQMIGQMIDMSTQTLKFFTEHELEYPTLNDLSVGLISKQGLVVEIRSSFNTQGEISDFASGNLSELRSRVEAMHGQLKDRIDGLLKDDAVTEMLQDDFYTLREDRYVLPIKSGHKRHVQGIVHGWSSSGATVFIEPQVVVEANNRLRIAQAEEKQEVHRILTKLSRKIANISNQLKETQEALIELDYSFACARLSKDLSCSSPHLNHEAQLKLVEARHPLLALSMEVKVVPNDIELGGDVSQVLVITGPNAGGKTVVMKTAGLLVMMATAALHIPAKSGSLVPWVSGLFSDMGDEQSLSEGQSTFSGHIANIQAILRRLKPQSFVLLDELAIGTDPIQGAALAQSILEHFVSQGSLVIVTTHFEALKLLSTENERFRNGAVEYDEEADCPTYKLKYDMPGSSSAIQIAAKLGLPSTLIERAKILTGEQHRRLEDAITRLEREVVGARRARREIDQESRRLKALNHEVEQREKKLKEKIQQATYTERNKAIKEARALRDEVKKLKSQLREHPMSVSELAEVERELTSSADQLFEAQTQDQLEAYPPNIDPSQLTLGQRVWVITLDMHAALTRLPDQRGRCAVQAGLLKIDVDLSALRKPRSVANPNAVKKASLTRKQKKNKRRTTRDQESKAISVPSWDRALPQTSDNTCDVRGLRSDQAVAKVIDCLDELYGRGVSTAYIIHGHGTGALKRSIREWLPRCDYVSLFRPGEQREGGDGVTAVLLTLQSL